MFALFRSLHRELRRFRPDATVTFTHYANVIGSLVALLAGIRWRIASQQNPGWSYPRFVRWIDRIAGSLGLYSANVAVSAAVRDSFATYPAAYRRRILVVPNGTAMRRSSNGRAETRTRLGLPVDAFLVLAVGRLHPQKNHGVLIRSIAATPEIRLAIAGDGELREDLEQLARGLGAADRVHFLGAIPGEEVSALIAASDVFAMPSRFEGLSLALLEALATPIAIAASDIPAQAEILAPAGASSCGLLLDCDDVGAWSAALMELANDAALRDRLASAAVRRASDFTLEATARGYEAAIA